KSVEHGKIVCRGRGVAFWKKGMFLHKRGEIDKFDTAWVSGGSGAFRRTYWIELGGMDERFNPFYWEDIDLSYRARKSGFILLFEPKSVVIHKHEEGVIKQMMTKRYVQRIAYRNQLLCIWKNITDLSYILEHIFYLHVRLFQSFFKHDNSFIRAYVDALFFLPSTIRERNKVRKMFILKDKNILKRG
ncbi:MAG: hypothetical protein N3A54_06900, partial [Patescibacteria group bacterium]|nr:hypothetical protein [Patescibacteria group bacterium]